MSTVPPELTRLGESYDALVNDAEAGHISHADALATLAALTVADASGAVWGMNANGDYVRSQYPGAPAQVCDPGMFAAAGAPAPSPFQNPGGFPQPAAPAPAAPVAPMAPAIPGPAVAQPPMAFPSPPGPVAQPPQQQAAPMSFPATAQDPFAAPPQGFSPEAALPSATNPIPDPHHHSAKKAPTKSISDAGKPSPLAGMFGKVRQLVGGNIVLVGIVLAGLVLFGVLALQSKNADTGSTTLPNGTSETTDTTLPGDGDGGELPTDGSQPPAAPALPSKAMATQMFSALSSGKRDLVAGTTAAAPDAKVAALAAAEWAGARQIGLTVTPGAAVAQGQGAVQMWTVADGSTTAATVKVTWVLAGDTWKLAQLPLFPNH